MSDAASTPLAGKKILLGVSGSIAAYKAVYLLRLLQQEGAELQVVMTAAAERFVGSLTFSTLARRPVFRDLWEEGEAWTQHVQLGKWADLMLIAPASANTISKLAAGSCDDALTAVFLSAACPVWLAPAMDREMMAHPATQQNLSQLQQWGYRILAAESGYLASGLSGAGRMMEPDVIAAAIRQHLTIPPTLAGKRVLITAGATREPIDPIRYLTNASSGKMGVALAEAALARGAQVTIVRGHTSVPPPPGAEVITVQTAREMYDAVLPRQQEQTIIIAAAAVGDYTLAEPKSDKIKKNGDRLNLELMPTPDILATLGAHKPAGQLLVGFALETQDEEANARKKLARKHLDLVALNSLREQGAGFQHDTNKITLLDAEGGIERYPIKSKRAVAEDILARLEHMLGAGTTAAQATSHPNA
jgi:phosphopantothenoylcysteine decarboxylase/phosphopantothenate--cysteine ligase